MAETNWYYTQADQRMGPVSLADLQARISGGEVKPHDLAWTDGMEQWARVDHLPILRVVPQPIASVAAVVTRVAPAPAQVAPIPAQIVPIAPHMEYASPVVGLPPRVAAALLGHTLPTGDTVDFPLDDLHLSQFEQTAKIRRKITASANLYWFLMVLSAASGVIMLIAAMFEAVGSSRDKDVAGGFLLFALISLFFAAIYCLAWRRTVRSQRWAPLAMFCFYALGVFVNLILTLTLLSKGPAATLSAFICLIISSAFAAISWRSFTAIPIYLAQPAWCQELLAKL